jgi:hypothetical protein
MSEPVVVTGTHILLHFLILASMTIGIILLILALRQMRLYTIDAKAVRISNIVICLIIGVIGVVVVPVLNIDKIPRCGTLSNKNSIRLILHYLNGEPCDRKIAFGIVLLCISNIAIAGADLGDISATLTAGGGILQKFNVGCVYHSRDYVDCCSIYAISNPSP